MKSLKLQGRLWLICGGRSLAGRGRVELLRRIDRLGSISKAAKAMKMSYKAAWDAVDAMNHTVGRPVAESSTGGTRGGGTRVTATGRRLISTYEKMHQQHEAFLERLSSRFQVL